MELDYAVLLDSMPNPLLVINDADRILYANASAEEFLQTSASGLARCKLSEVIPFASPLHALIAQVREQGSTVNEYAITIGTPRTGGERTVDVQLAAVQDGSAYVILTLMQRSMAQKIDRQLTHRGGARSVIGMASMLAHEIKNPLSGIRGAAQLLEPSLNGEDRALTQLICGETDRIRDLVDQMEVFSDDRPIERAPINIHAVLE
ncbi:MAG: PAS domain-containing protein, partial [Aestuariivirgaceae bacterium]|nr:PAS domain-containing protein [Aestuariivirgaceae bacterium]